MRIIPYALLLPLSVALSAQSWMPVGPYGGYIRSLAYDDSGYVYAATYLGGIYRSTNGAVEWTEIYSDTLKADFRSVAVNSKGYIYGGTDGFGIQRSEDGGTTWQRLTGFLFNATVQALYVLPNDIILAGATDGVYQSDNDGDSFTYTSTGLTNKFITDFARIDSGHFLVATRGGGVFGSVDGGFTWSPSSTGMQLNDLDIYGLAVKSGNEVWAAAGSQLYKTVDGGGNWTSVHPAPTASYSGITFTPDGTIYAAATTINNAIGGGVYKSMDDSGFVWTKQSGLLNIPHFDILSVGGRVLTGTEGPGVYYTTSSPDSQDTWTQGVNGMNNTHITGIEQLDDSTFFAITKYAGMFSSWNRGMTWQNVTTGLPHAWLNSIAVNPVNGHVFTATASFTYRSTDRGATFQQTRTSGATVLKFNPQGILFAGYGGLMSKTTDEGGTWSSTFLNGVNNISDIAFDGDTIYAATGDLKGTSGQGVFRSLDLGVTYIPHNNGLTNTNVTAISATPPDSLTSCPRITVGTKGGGEFSLDQTTGEWGSSGLAGTSIVQLKATVTSPRLLLGIAAAFLYARNATCIDNVLALTPVELTGMHPFRALLSNAPLRGPLDDVTVLLGTNGQGILLGSVTVTSVDEHYPDIPTEARLEQNYPNPFNPSTQITYTIAGVRGSEVSVVRLVVFDILGREVAVLVNEPKGPGTYSVTWNATGLASGTYMCRLSVGGNLVSKKMMLLR
jgi:hypothetical protein